MSISSVVEKIIASFEALPADKQKEVTKLILQHHLEVSSNDVFDFLNDESEDIYTLEDGKTIE